MARSAEEQHRINRMIVKKVRQSGRGEQSKAGKAKDNAGTVGTARAGTAKTGKGTAKAGKGTAKAGTANLARLQVASKMAKAGRKQDGPEIKAKKHDLAARWMALVMARNHLQKAPADAAIKALLIRQGASCTRLGYKEDSASSINCVRNIWTRKIGHPPSSALAAILASTIRKHEQGDNDIFCCPLPDKSWMFPILVVLPNSKPLHDRVNCVRRYSN